MACHKHKKDANWPIDLVWKYLHEASEPGARTGSWFKKMDPGGLLNDRHGVYEMLVDQPAHTNPSTEEEVAKSMIPWNQNNKGLLEAFDNKWACGSVVKLSFLKYMGWGNKDYKSKEVGSKGFDAAQWIAEGLWKGMAVRAHLGRKHHYVGIVGYRTTSYSNAKKRFEYEFLVMDPWAGGAATGGNTIVYAGATTAFLGIMKEAGDQLPYDTFEATAVAGPHPF